MIYHKGELPFMTSVFTRKAYIEIFDTLQAASGKGNGLGVWGWAVSLFYFYKLRSTRPAHTECVLIVQTSYMYVMSQLSREPKNLRDEIQTGLLTSFWHGFIGFAVARHI